MLVRMFKCFFVWMVLSCLARPGIKMAEVDFNIGELPLIFFLSRKIFSAWRGKVFLLFAKMEFAFADVFLVWGVYYFPRDAENVFCSSPIFFSLTLILFLGWGQKSNGGTLIWLGAKSFKNSGERGYGLSFELFYFERPIKRFHAPPYFYSSVSLFLFTELAKTIFFYFFAPRGSRRCVAF